MFKPILLSLTALSLSFAQAASADEYTIHVEEGAFYPEITYLVPGDIVEFINNNDASIEAVASDASWSTGALGTNESYLLTVSAETTPMFALVSDSEIAGMLSFDFAPLSDVDENGDPIEEGEAPEVSN